MNDFFVFISLDSSLSLSHSHWFSQLWQCTIKKKNFFFVLWKSMKGIHVTQLKCKQRKNERGVRNFFNLCFLFLQRKTFFSWFLCHTIIFINIISYLWFVFFFRSFILFLKSSSSSSFFPSCSLLHSFVILHLRVENVLFEGKINEYK